ncbi:ABC transporter ATP-binding protein [Alicyclobacillus fodiniaquatilis]|uniref:ABC transporter ATP-binding protein n=1 Tax=Alicyclobacillus fodiniaquatilis TaxID=1661150 RepID=A0ABW4JKC5_9BACL
MALSTRYGNGSTAVISDDVSCRIQNVTVKYKLDNGEFAAIRSVSANIPSGKITAMIGESGSGKTTLGLAMLNGVSHPGRVAEGVIEYTGVGDILSKEGEELRKLRGKHVGMVFQAAQSSLNPLKKVGSIIIDLAKSHGYEDPKVLIRSACDLARRMSLDPDRVLSSFQHQLSGGMRQRVSIILALILEPKILILDEPTTALDILSQATVLKVLREIQEERELTTVLITHDMGVVAELSDQVYVMYAGKIVEEGNTSELLQNPRHPYTRALIQAIPRLTGDRSKAVPLLGSPPEISSTPNEGCVFAKRCAFRLDICEYGETPRRITDDGHQYLCHLNEEGLA